MFHVEQSPEPRPKALPPLLIALAALTPEGAEGRWVLYSFSNPAATGKGTWWGRKSEWLANSGKPLPFDGTELAKLGAMTEAGWSAGLPQPTPDRKICRLFMVDHGALQAREAGSFFEKIPPDMRMEIRTDGDGNASEEEITAYEAEAAAEAAQAAALPPPPGGAAPTPTPQPAPAPIALAAPQAPPPPPPPPPQLWRPPLQSGDGATAIAHGAQILSAANAELFARALQLGELHAASAAKAEARHDAAEERAAVLERRVRRAKRQLIEEKAKGGLLRLGERALTTLERLTVPLIERIEPEEAFERLGAGYARVKNAISGKAEDAPPPLNQAKIAKIWAKASPEQRAEFARLAAAADEEPTP